MIAKSGSLKYPNNEIWEDVDLKLITSGFAFLAAVLLVLAGGAAAAYASASVTYGNNVVIAAYNHLTDKLSVYDGKQDGFGGRSIYELSNGATGNLDNDKGFGTTTYKTIRGSGTITFKACTKQGALTKFCSPWVSSQL